MLKKKPTSSNATQFIENVKKTNVSKTSSKEVEKSVTFICPASFFSKFKLLAVKKEEKQAALFSQALHDFVRNNNIMLEALDLLPSDFEDLPCKTVSIKIPQSTYKNIKLVAAEQGKTQKEIYVATIYYLCS